MAARGRESQKTNDAYDHTSDEWTGQRVPVALLDNLQRWTFPVPAKSSCIVGDPPGPKARQRKDITEAKIRANFSGQVSGLRCPCFGTAVRFRANHEQTGSNQHRCQDIVDAIAL